MDDDLDSLFASGEWDSPAILSTPEIDSGIAVPNYTPDAIPFPNVTAPASSAAVASPGLAATPGILNSIAGVIRSIGSAAAGTPVKSVESNTLGGNLVTAEGSIGSLAGGVTNLVVQFLPLAAILLVVFLVFGVFKKAHR